MANEVIEWEPSGRVLPIFQGDYDAGRVYENPDVVLYKNCSYVAKRTTVGNCPPTKTYSDDSWQMIAKGIVDANISESTIEFDEAEERNNIESGEESQIIMGKIRKFFADLKLVAFSGKYSDLIGRLTISNSAAVTQTGQMALDAVEKNAAVAGTLANQIAQQNSKKVNFTDITRSAAVNVAGKMALDAVEKNALVEGTMAHDISQIYSNFSKLVSGLTNEKVRGTILYIGNVRITDFVGHYSWYRYYIDLSSHGFISYVPIIVQNNLDDTHGALEQNFFISQKGSNGFFINSAVNNITNIAVEILIVGWTSYES